MKILKWLGSIILLLLGYSYLKEKSDKKKADFDKTKEIVETKTEEAVARKKKALDHLNKANVLDAKRKKNKNKYRHVVHVLVFLILITSLSGEYIVCDEEDKINYDYGTITNYIRSLKSDNRDLLAIKGYLHSTIEDYSNAYASMSNASHTQTIFINQVEEEQPTWWENLWCDHGWWVSLILGGAAGYSIAK